MYINLMLPHLKCLDNSEELVLRGNFESIAVSTLIVRLVRCSDRSTCKTDSEIDDFMDKHGHMFLLYNDLCNWSKASIFTV